VCCSVLQLVLSKDLHSVLQYVALRCTVQCVAVWCRILNCTCTVFSQILMLYSSMSIWENVLMSHVTHLNDSCCTSERVMSRVCRCGTSLLCTDGRIERASIYNTREDATGIHTHTWINTHTHTYTNTHTHTYMHFQVVFKKRITRGVGNRSTVAITTVSQPKPQKLNPKTPKTDPQTLTLDPAIYCGCDHNEST